MPSPSEYNEQELLQQSAGGDEEAFTRLFNTYYPLLSTLVYRLTRSLPVTEEIVQDVFLKIWMGRESLGELVSFKAFLWVVARNHALNVLKKMAREEVQRQVYAKQADMSGGQPEEDVHDFYHTLIDEAIGQLPPQQQRVYLLSRQERLRQADIADVMGLTVPTVKKYMQLAVEAISQYVREHAISVAGLLVLIFF